MMRIFEALAGYILAVFAAAFVIVISVTPVMSWFGAGVAGVQSGLLDLGIFWISAALRIAIVAFIPALIGMIIANTTGRRSTLFYCLWAIATAIGLSLL
ncbi:MAG: hypothetical protein ACR2O4_05755, partial [Hyphomicrobiaceae bacterium]